MVFTINDVLDDFEAGTFAFYEEFMAKAEEFFKKSKDEGGIDMTSLLYAGFDPKTFLRHLAKRYKDKGDQDRFLRHTVTVCYLFVSRGTKLKKILERTGTEGKRIVQDIISSSTLSDSTTSPITPTINRWACCFPYIVANMIKDHHAGISKMVCDEYGFPSWLATPGILGLFNPDSLGTHLCKVACVMYFVFSELLTKKINSMTKTAPPKPRVAGVNQTITIMNASLGNGAADEELSKLQLTKLGIIYTNLNNFKNSWGGLKLMKRFVDEDNTMNKQFGVIQVAGFHTIEFYIQELYSRDNALFINLKTFLEKGISSKISNGDVKYADFLDVAPHWPKFTKDDAIDTDFNRLCDLMNGHEIVYKIQRQHKEDDRKEKEKKGSQGGGGGGRRRGDSASTKKDGDEGENGKKTVNDDDALPTNDDQDILREDEIETIGGDNGLVEDEDS